MKDERRRLPRQHRDGRPAERARGGERAGSALRPPLQQGPDDLGGLRRPVPRAVDAGRRPDLRPADHARDRTAPWASPSSSSSTPAPARGGGALVPSRCCRRFAVRAATVEHALTTQRGRGGAAGRARRSRAASARSWPSAATAPGATSPTASCARASRRALGLVPGGTGCDLAKSLGIPAQDVAAARARRSTTGARAPIDVGRIEDKHFLNVAGFGYDIAVIEDSWRVRWLQGDLLYLYCALRQLGRSRASRSRSRSDGARARAPRAADAGAGQRAHLRRRVQDRAARPTSTTAGSTRSPSATWACLRRLSMLVRAAARHARQLARRRELRAAARYRLRFVAPPAYETDGEWNQAQSAELVMETVPGRAARAGAGRRRPGLRRATGPRLRSAFSVVLVMLFFAGRRALP